MTSSADVRGAAVLTGVHDPPSHCSTHERVEDPPLDHPTAQQSSGIGHAVRYGRAASAVFGVGVSVTVHWREPPGRPVAPERPGSRTPESFALGGSDSGPRMPGWLKAG